MFNIFYMFIFSIFNISFSNGSFSTNISIYSTLSHPWWGAQGRGTFLISPLQYDDHSLSPFPPSTRALTHGSLTSVPTACIFSCQRPRHSHALHVPHDEHFQLSISSWQLSMSFQLEHLPLWLFIVFSCFSASSYCSLLGILHSISSSWLLQFSFLFDFYTLLANTHSYTVSDIIDIWWWLLNLNL